MDGGHMTFGDWFWMIFLWMFLFWSTMGILGVWAVKTWQSTRRELSVIRKPHDLAA